jgi:hypothetical protein
MSTIKKITIVLGIVLVAFTAAQAIDVNINIGTGGYYNPVGNYDYLPYAYATNPSFVAPRVNFYDMYSDYGAWVNVSPFGQAWQPYVSQGWRPYTYGHWAYTSQYGPMWQGYEPWAWAGYHYGNWIFSQQYGWVMIPSTQWSPGNVAWSYGYDTLGWMPLPPTGYDYSRGYLSPMSGFNQFGCNDDFSVGINFGGIGVGFGQPYDDPRCRSLYYNQSYLGVAPNLWTFIGASDFGYDNYADYYLGPDYVRTAFDTRVLRITTQPLQRTVIERITRTPVREIRVVEKQLQTDKQSVRVVVPADEQEIERVRKHSNDVVQEVIAPGFVKRQKSFKGETATAKDAVATIFKEDLSQPKVQKFDASRAEQVQQQREQRRAEKVQVAKQKIDQARREGKIKEPQGKGVGLNRTEPGAETNVPQNVETERERGRNQNTPPEEQAQREKGKKTNPDETTTEEPSVRGKQKRTVPGETTPEEQATRDREKKSNVPGETTPDVDDQQRTKRNQDTVEPGNENAGTKDTEASSSQNQKTDKSSDKKESDEKSKGKKKTDKNKDKDKTDEQP